MGLSAGTTLGPYEVVESIGAGGIEFLIRVKCQALSKKNSSLFFEL